MSWMAHLSGSVRHVWPEDETDHNLNDDMDCWCNAETKVADGGIVLRIHSSKDGREFIERLKDKDNLSPN